MLIYLLGRIYSYANKLSDNHIPLMYRSYPTRSHYPQVATKGAYTIRGVNSGCLCSGLNQLTSQSVTATGTPQYTWILTQKSKFQD